MRITINKITSATVGIAFCAFAAQAQTSTTSARPLSSPEVNPAPNLIIIGAQVISPAETPSANGSSAVTPGTAQQNRGLGIGQQGTGAIGQQGGTLLGPPPVFPPPAPVPQAPAPVLTPPAPVMTPPTPAITPPAIQPAIPPQGLGPVIPAEPPPQNLTPLPPPEVRGLGIGQQGSGTAIGQPGTALIGPQGNGAAIGQQGTTPVSPPPANQNGTSPKPQENFTAIDLQSTAILGPPGSFSTPGQLPLVLSLPSAGSAGNTASALTTRTIGLGRGATASGRSVPAAARSLTSAR